MCKAMAMSPTSLFFLLLFVQGCECFKTSLLWLVILKCSSPNSLRTNFKDCPACLDLVYIQIKLCLKQHPLFYKVHCWFHTSFGPNLISVVSIYSYWQGEDCVNNLPQVCAAP